MEKDIEKTDIIFRVNTNKKDKGTVSENCVFAVFPHEVCDKSGNVTTYQHVGQHSGGDYQHCLTNSRPATEEECKSLKTEMESIGYNINVVKKRNYEKYIKSYWRK